MSPDDMPRSRPEALALNAPYFYTGRPCARGHVEPRRTINSVCVVCHREKVHARTKQQRQEYSARRRAEAPAPAPRAAAVDRLLPRDTGWMNEAERDRQAREALASRASLREFARGFKDTDDAE